jgi:hypothetical protein
MQGSVVLLVKNVENNKKLFFRSIDLYRRGHYILGHTLQYIGVQNFVFTMWASYVSKDSEFYVDFKNINLP